MGIEARFAYKSFRPGQKELAHRIYEACLGGEILVAEASSGFGKTAAVIAGALTAAEESQSKIVYACRTKRQVNRVVEEVSRLQDTHRFQAVPLFAKFDYCLLRRQRPIPQESFGWYCSFNVSNNLCSYFLNVPLTEGFDRLVSQVLTKTPHHSELLRTSEITHVCPYEVARLAVTQAELVIVPYQYAFDPRAASTLFDKNQVDRKDTILIVDEAHNLRDFFRGMNSATLTLSEVEGAAREAQAMLMDEAANSLRSLLRTLQAVMGESQGWLLDKVAFLDRIRNDHGTVWLQNLAFELSASSGAAWGSVVYERQLPSMILRVGNFLVRLPSPGTTLVKWDNTLGLINPDPVHEVEERLTEFKCSVLLSATVNPSGLYVKSLGLVPGKAKMYDASAEPSVLATTAVDTGTSTRYKLRTPEMYTKISNRVAAVIRGTDSGVGIFVPSYSVLQPILEQVTGLMPERNIVSEAQGLSGEQAEEVYNSFRSSDGAVLFGVQGGRFSEGEDFEGGAMGAVVVIGMAIPPPSPMMYAEYSYLKRMGEQDSYMMLSRLPALRKAFQAAGRHMRGPGKRGLVFFLDERFGSPSARELMPSWLRRDLVVCDLTPDRIESISREFWSRHG